MFASLSSLIALSDVVYILLLHLESIYILVLAKRFSFSRGLLEICWYGDGVMEMEMYTVYVCVRVCTCILTFFPQKMNSP